MDSIPLQILRLVKQIVSLEESMVSARTDTVAGRYVVGKLEKYLAKAYSHVAALYDARHFTRAQYERDAVHVDMRGGATQPPRAVPRWVDMDIEKHYRSKVDAFFRAHTLDVEETVRTIRLGYRPVKNVYEKFLCAAEINRYLRFYAELHGIGRGSGHALRREARGGADTGAIYCMVCRRAIVRKMVGHHLGASTHTKKAHHFKGKNQIFDYSKKYGQDIHAHIHLLQSRNEGLLRRIGRDRGRGALCPPCKVCSPRYGSRCRCRVRENGPGRTERQDLDFEEFEDEEGNVYDRRTYEDLVNNLLL